MADFSDSYVGRLRAKVGHDLLMIPGTRIFLENGEGKLLMQLRRDFRVWGFLGGNVEVGEPMEDCIAREVMEEVGVEVGDLVPVAYSCDPREETLTYPNGDLCQFYVLMYWTRTFKGTPTIRDEESLELGWFGPDDWPEMLPTMRRGLDAFLEYRRTGQFQVL
jgi:8-oxo-dGTP pyrophosphatase MutT (NUDIX family)